MEHVQCDPDFLRDGNMPIDEAVLKKSKWNKYVEETWGMSVDCADMCKA